jgi:hypothetical protein
MLASFSSTFRPCNRSIAAKSHCLFHSSARMSSASLSSALYATVSSSSLATGTVPEHTKELRHHNKHGKGFVNPWDSYVDRSAYQISSAILWSDFDTHPNKDTN